MILLRASRLRRDKGKRMLIMDSGLWIRSFFIQLGGYSATRSKPEFKLRLESPFGVVLRTKAEQCRLDEV